MSALKRLISRHFLAKVMAAVGRRAEAAVGRLRPIAPVLEAMVQRPFELHLELTNLCNANCVFCPYQFRVAADRFMSRELFDKALGQYVASGGGSLLLTPLVGEPLLHPDFLDYVRRARAEPRIDRIKVITNALQIHRVGARALIDSGLTSILISTAGFDEGEYRRTYRSKRYDLMRRNVLDLLKANREAGSPVTITLGFRGSRGIDEILDDPDAREILDYDPGVEFTWAYTTAGGRIRPEMIFEGMRLRSMPAISEACVNVYNGPMVLADGTITACGCVASMDREADLAIGHMDEESLVEAWCGERARRLRASFGDGALNGTCSHCDMYTNLGLYRTSEGRERARINRLRADGEVVRRAPDPGGHSGG